MQQKQFFSMGVPAVLLITGSLFCLQGGDKKPQGGAEGAMDPAKMMEMMPKSGPEHAALMRDVGIWDAKQTLNMPGTPPMESKGTETITAFGPFFIHSDYRGDMMGQPFTGMATVGYDPAKKAYVGTWHDTSSPYIMWHEGQMDEKTKTMTMTGTMPDMMDPTKIVKMRMTTTWKSADAKTFMMYSTEAGGKEELGMVIEYTRRKK